MVPRPTAKYVGYGPLTLARLTHKFEDEDDDVEFLAIQDAVSVLSSTEQGMYRRAYIDMMRSQYRRLEQSGTKEPAHKKTPDPSGPG